MILPLVLCYSVRLEVHALFAVHLPAVAAKRDKVLILAFTAYLSKAAIHFIYIKTRI